VNPRTGDVAFVGYFAGTLDFGGQKLVSLGNGDVFVSKFDASGKFIWAKRFGDAADQRTTNVVFDANNDIIVLGEFGGTINFGSAADLASLGATDVFVAKLDTDGNHVWSKGFGGSLVESGKGLALDGCGNVLIIGDVASTINFGGATLTSAGGIDFFVAKLDPAGGHVWSHIFGDDKDQHGAGIAAGPGDAVFVAGYYAGTVDFVGVPKLSSVGNFDIFVARLAP
jgi:hypothetical protein